MDSDQRPSAPTPLPEVRLQTLARTVGHWLVRDDGPIPRPDFIDLNAPYQRGSVWTVDQRRALIKSLLMGLPVGSIITSDLPYTEGSPFSYRVVDGKQRVETIRGFVASEFDVPGWWWHDDLVERVGPDGMVGWEDLTRKGRLTFDNRQMPELLFNGLYEYLMPAANGKWTHRRRTGEEILRAEAELYLLVNGGGTAQTAEDMARAAEIAR